MNKRAALEGPVCDETLSGSMNHHFAHAFMAILKSSKQYSMD